MQHRLIASENVVIQLQLLIVLHLQLWNGINKKSKYVRNPIKKVQTFSKVNLQLKSSICTINNEECPSSDPKLDVLVKEKECVALFQFSGDACGYTSFQKFKIELSLLVFFPKPQNI